MHAVSFHIPGEPIGKGRPRLTTASGFARAYTPAKTRSYEALVSLAAQAAMRTRPPWKRDVALSCRVVATCLPPASWSKRKQREALEGLIHPVKKPDLDNIVKAILDGMQGVVFTDDVQVVALSIRKNYGEQPGLTVEIAPVTAGNS